MDSKRFARNGDKEAHTFETPNLITVLEQGVVVQYTIVGTLVAKKGKKLAGQHFTARVVRRNQKKASSRRDRGEGRLLWYDVDPETGHKESSSAPSERADTKCAVAVYHRERSGRAVFFWSISSSS